MRLLASIINISFVVFHSVVAISAEPRLQHFLNTGHAYAISDVAISFDGTHLVTAGYDSKAILWETKSGKKIREIRGHKGRIFSIAMADDGKSFVTGSYDQTAILWDAVTGKQLQTFKHADWVWNVAISPDGKFVLTGAGDGQATLWDATTGKKVRTMVKLKGGAPEVAFSADNKRTVITHGKTMAVWDAMTGKKLRTINADDDVVDIAISGNGEFILASLSQRNRAVLWDAVTGKALGRVDTGARHITSIRLSRDDKRVLVGTTGETAFLWDIATGQRIQTFASGTQGIADIRCVALNGNGSSVITVTDGRRTAVLWDAKTGKPLHTFGRIASTGHAVTLSADGNYLATAAGKSAGIWDTATARRVQHLSGHGNEVYSIALSADGKLAVTGSADRTAILWETATGRKLKSFSAHNDSVKSVDISNDGKYVVTSSDGDGTAILWSAATGKKLRVFQGKTKPDDASNRFSTICLSPNGRYLVTGAFDSTVTLWDAGTGKRLLEYPDQHSQEIASIAFSRDGKRVITGSWANVNTWETSTGKQLSNIRQFAGFTRVAIRGDLFLAATEANTTQVWKTSSRKHLQTLHGHTEVIWGTALSNDGRFAWTTSGDGTTRLWRVVDGKELLRLISFDQGDDWLAITPDGYFDGSEAAWNLVTYRELSSGKLIDGLSVRKKFQRKGRLINHVRTRGR